MAFAEQWSLENIPTRPLLCPLKKQAQERSDLIKATQQIVAQSGLTVGMGSTVLADELWEGLGWSDVSSA